MKEFIKKIPVFGDIVRQVYRWLNRAKSFRGSTNYWKQRYASGGNSGPGSYNELAEFKAEILNSFVKENNIRTIIEYGCGDGNQLKLARYPSYTGFDISPEAISRCNGMFPNDNTKIFKLMEQYQGEMADLTLSLDVIFHLVEDDVFHNYMDRLFNSSTRFVVIYSSNTNHNASNQPPHVKHRKFTDWIEQHQHRWKLNTHIPNKYPLGNNDIETGSFADFYIFEKS